MKTKTLTCVATYFFGNLLQKVFWLWKELTWFFIDILPTQMLQSEVDAGKSNSCLLSVLFFVFCLFGYHAVLEYLMKESYFISFIFVWQVIYSDEDRKFNKDITIGLIHSELLNLAEYNVHMAKLLDAGRNSMYHRY